MFGKPLFSRAFATLAAIGCVAFFTCETALAEDPAIVKVTREGIRFVVSPSDVPIKQGESVTWVPEEGEVVHHLIAVPPGGPFPDSGEFNRKKLEKHTQVFKDVGTFGYRCLIHGSMKGKIIVGAAEGTKEPKPSQ